MPDIRPISFVEYMDQGVDMLGFDHAAETEPLLGVDGPKLVKPAYEALEEQGALVTFGAFDGDEIVGYSVAIISPHLHYGFLYAHHDLLYIAPKYRRGSTGLQMIRRTEAECKKRGAKCITWHVKPDTSLQKILDRMKYGVEEIVYLKEF